MALNELSNTTKENCPDTDSDEETSTAPTSDRPREDSPDNKEDLSMNINPHLQYTARYACMRNSPMKCPNQALVARLDILRQQREFDGLGIRALSYARAIAVCPICSAMFTCVPMRYIVVRPSKVSQMLFMRWRA